MPMMLYSECLLFQGNFFQRDLGKQLSIRNDDVGGIEVTMRKHLKPDER